MSFGAVIGGLLGPVFGVIDKAVGDKDLREQLKFQLQSAALAGEFKALEEAASNVRSETTGESWLQRVWRPVLMLTFGALIVARWLGFTAPGIDPATEGQLLEIIKIGLGGYVFGRSGEKIAGIIAPALKKEK